MSRMRGLAFGVLLLSSAAVQAAPFQNGSFESGTLVNTGSFDELHMGATAITGWSVLGPAGVDYVSSGYWQAADGTRSLDLVGCDRETGGQGGVEQTFDTVPGVRYTVTFAMAGNPGEPLLKTLQVSAAGRTESYSFDATGKTGGNMGWTGKTFWFDATGTSTTLRFDNTSDASRCAGAALDNVVVTAAPGAVPVQDSAWGAAAAIMLASLFVLPWLRRRDGR